MTVIQTLMLFGAGVFGSGDAGPDAEAESPMTYEVQQAPADGRFDGEWEGDFWKDVSPLALTHWMGDKPEHFPPVQAKMLYDDAALYVMFRVDDQYVRAVAQKHQDAVYKDSCVEFFFTPQSEVGHGYFNLEMNCGGTMLLHFQRVPRQNPVLLAAADLAEIEVVHSLPKIVDPELTTPTQWSVAYRIPLRLVQKYFPASLQQRAPGVTWRANFYKCADDTSHPHWLTWSPVAHDQPDFHRPQSFGTLTFR